MEKNKKPRKKTPICVRVGRDDREWLEDQVDPYDDDIQTVPGVIRKIIKDARRRKPKDAPPKP